ncbi:MAG: uroporphyrinogen decarboxylase family protein [Phycisphaerae bacterium]
MKIDFAQLHRQVVFGKSDGRIIWQPRIGCWYSDKLFEKQPLPAPFTGMDLPAIYRELNCSARIYDYDLCLIAVEHPAVKIVTHAINETDTETVIETPVGTQRQVLRVTPTCEYPKHVKWPVSCEEELKVATWRKENTTWRWDPSVFDQMYQTWGDLGAATMCLPRVNIQDLYIDTMGTQNSIYALYDWPDTVQAYFRALDECHDRLIDVINASPIDIINFGDNLHGGTLPPDLFVRYVLPTYQKRCEKLHRAGKFVHAHWDGDTKPLLPFARQTGLDGIEAITPKPQGDVTLEEIKDALGDDMFLIDGIPAIYFDHTFTIDVLEDCVRRLIDLFAPKLVLGISDEISSTGDIERIRFVGKIVDEYNAKPKKTTRL